MRDLVVSSLVQVTKKAPDFVGFKIKFSVLYNKKLKILPQRLCLFQDGVARVQVTKNTASGLSFLTDGVVSEQLTKNTASELSVLPDGEVSENTASKLSFLPDGVG